jgi:hypothetical protein
MESLWNNNHNSDEQARLLFTAAKFLQRLQIDRDWL